MSQTFDDTNRQTMPRCLDYSTACALGLLRANRTKENAAKTRSLNSRTLHGWQDSPNLAAAVDLVGEAVIVREFDSEPVARAADFILDNAPESSTLLRKLAGHFLERSSSDTYGPDIECDTEVDRRRIAQLKAWVRSNPVNPIAWSDLSFCYATLGQEDKTREAMEVALNLGKNNRFILRSAARCYVHLGDADRAVAILNRSGFCLLDPWIASAEVAISESAGLRSKCVSKARQLVQNDKFTRFSRSELAATVGTLEIKNGSAKNAKRLLHMSLRDPTENALAQAEWMATHLGTPIGESMGDVPASYEAQARHFYYAKEFAKSINAAERWARFQPLSSRPIILSSFLASTCLNNDKEALRILGRATPAQLNDPLLTNNRAFCLARTGDIAGALVALDGVVSPNLSDRDKLTISATRGLVAFRKGDPEEGRRLYSLAIEGFEKGGNPRSAAVAAYFWAAEEKLLGSTSAPARVGDAKNRIKRFHVFELAEMADQL